MVDVVKFTDAGATAVWAAIDTGDVYKYVGVGTGGERGADETHTSLATEVDTPRTVGVLSASSQVLTVVQTWTCGATPRLIDEAGIFSASTGGTMLCEATFTEISVVQNDTIQFTFNLTLNQAA